MKNPKPFVDEKKEQADEFKERMRNRSSGSHKPKRIPRLQYPQGGEQKDISSLEIPTLTARRGTKDLNHSGEWSRTLNPMLLSILGIQPICTPYSCTRREARSPSLRDSPTGKT